MTQKPNPQILEDAWSEIMDGQMLKATNRCIQEK